MFNVLTFVARPQPAEFLVKFFPELIDKKVPEGNKEASKELNIRICEAIMADMMDRYDRAYSYLGAGAIILNLIAEKGHPDRSNYINEFMMSEDLKDAERNNDATVVEFCKDALKTIKGANPKEEICLILIDKSGASCTTLPRENPAGRIAKLMNDL